MSEKTKIAENLGRKAFKNGTIRAPAQDKEMMAMLEGKPVGDRETIPLLKAWNRGYTDELLKAPILFRVEWLNFGKWVHNNQDYKTTEEAEKTIAKMVNSGYNRQMIRITPIYF